MPKKLASKKKRKSILFDGQMDSPKQMVIRNQIESEWPALKLVKYDMKEDPNFLAKFSVPQFIGYKDLTGDIEYISPWDNPDMLGRGRVTYFNNEYPAKTDWEKSGTQLIVGVRPEYGTLYYNSTVPIEAIKLDALHALNDLDAGYLRLQSEFMNTLDWNNKDALSTLGDYDPSDPNILQLRENATAGIIRNLNVPADKAYEMRYDDPEAVRKRWLTTRQSLTAYNNLMRYVLGASIGPETIVIRHKK